MHELKKNGKILTSKSVGTGPSSYEKRIYRAAVSQRLRNAGLDDQSNAYGKQAASSVERPAIDKITAVKGIWWQGGVDSLEWDRVQYRKLVDKVINSGFDKTENRDKKPSEKKADMSDRVFGLELGATCSCRD